MNTVKLALGTSAATVLTVASLAGCNSSSSPTAHHGAQPGRLRQRVRLHCRVRFRQRVRFRGDCHVPRNGQDQRRCLPH